MALELIIGPAHAGKIAALYERYLAELAAGRTAALVVPDQTAKVVTERELLARATGVVGADVVTFDTLFERIARATGDRRTVVHGAARQVLLRRAETWQLGQPVRCSSPRALTISAWRKRRC